MDLKTNWNVFSKNRDAIYGVAIISIIIFHFFEDVASSNISGGGDLQVKFIIPLLVVLVLNFLYFCLV